MFPSNHYLTLTGQLSQYMKLLQPKFVGKSGSKRETWVLAFFHKEKVTSMWSRTRRPNIYCKNIAFLVHFLCWIFDNLWHFARNIWHTNWAIQPKNNWHWYSKYLTTKQTTNPSLPSIDQSWIFWQNLRPNTWLCHRSYPSGAFVRVGQFMTF
jgi:hypothetical protein